MSEAGYNPEIGQRQTGRFRQMVRNALGRVSTDSSVGSDVEVHRGSIEPIGEVVTGEIVEGEIALRPNTARLPEQFVEKDLLGLMEVGTHVYTVPWAMAVTQEGHCFLNGRYTHKNQTGGTVQMKVERIDEGYVVHVPQGYKYQPVEQIPWVGANAEHLLPVHEVREGDTFYG